MAPSPANFLACPRAVEMLEDLPPFLREDPDVRAVIYCFGREAERQELTLDVLLQQFFPQTATSLGLPWWETLTELTVAPMGAADEDRQATVVAFLRRLVSALGGLDWVDAVTTLVGSGWTYEELPNYTIRINLPFPPDGDRYAQTERFIRGLTPAHLDLVVGFTGGFLLDGSQLDEEPME